MTSATAERPKGDSRTYVCAICSKSVTHRKSTTLEGSDRRFCKNHTVRCRICSRNIKVTKSVLTKLGRVCPSHEGIGENIIDVEPNWENDSTGGGGDTIQVLPETG